MQRRPWAAFRRTFEDLKHSLSPSVLTGLAEMFQIAGDVHAMLYTGSRAMHSSILHIFSDQVLRMPSLLLFLVYLCSFFLKTKLSNLSRNLRILKGQISFLVVAIFFFFFFRCWRLSVYQTLISRLLNFFDSSKGDNFDSSIVGLQ